MINWSKSLNDFRNGLNGSTNPPTYQNKDDNGERANNQYPPEPDKNSEAEVFQFHGGHRAVFRHTPGKESVTFHHPSGTTMSIYPDGSVYQISVGENKAYNKAGATITVDENNDIVFKGHTSIKCLGGAHIEVSGDTGVVSAGKTVVNSLGDLALNANGNMYVGVKGDLNMNIGGKTTVQSDGNVQIHTNAQANYLADGTTTVSSEGDTKLNASGDVITKGATTKIQGGGVTTWQPPGSPLNTSTWT